MRLKHSASVIIVLGVLFHSHSLQAALIGIGGVIDVQAHARAEWTPDDNHLDPPIIDQDSDSDTEWLYGAGVAGFKNVAVDATARAHDAAGDSEAGITVGWQIDGSGSLRLAAPDLSARGGSDFLTVSQGSSRINGKAILFLRFDRVTEIRGVWAVSATDRDNAIIETVVGGKTNTSGSFTQYAALTNAPGFSAPGITWYLNTHMGLGAYAFEGREEDHAFAELKVLWGTDFIPGEHYLRPLLPDSGSRFSVPVIGGGFGMANFAFIDPDYATGYDYSSDIPFTSVIVPTALPNGDDTFQVHFNGISETLLAGAAFDFTDFVAGGVTDFTIDGIDPLEMIDPTDPLGFVTGLKYSSAGLSTTSMIAISSPSQSAVPEPGSFAIWSILGVVGLLANRRRTRRTA